MKKYLRKKLSFILRIKTRNSFGQSIIDFALAFIAIAVLSVGIARIWIWFSANFARRQVNYQQSRIVAGVPSSYETLGKGKTFAWSALVEPHVLTASVKCVEKAQVISIKASDLERVFKERPIIEVVVMKNLAGVISYRLRESRAQLLHLIAEMVKQGKY